MRKALSSLNYFAAIADLHLLVFMHRIFAPLLFAAFSLSSASLVEQLPTAPQFIAVSEAPLATEEGGQINTTAQNQVTLYLHNADTVGGVRAESDDIWMVK